MAGFKKRSAEEIQAEVDKYSAEMVQAAHDYTASPEKLTEFLAFMARFPEYPARNQMLIAMQNVTAFAVGGYDRFKKLGYPVRKGQKGIKIFAPAKGKVLNLPDHKKIPFWRATKEQRTLVGTGEATVSQGVSGFHLTTVFDVRQTDMPADEYPTLYPNRPVDFAIDDPEMNQLLSDHLDALSASRGIPIEEMPDLSQLVANGVYHGGEHKFIEVEANLPDTQKTAIRIHEIAHSYMHDGSKAGRDEKELQAEMVSFIVSAHYGIDTKETAAPYIAGWTKEMATLTDKYFQTQFKIMDDVSKTAKEIIANVDASLARELIPEKEIGRAAGENREQEKVPSSHGDDLEL